MIIAIDANNAFDKVHKTLHKVDLEKTSKHNKGHMWQTYRFVNGGKLKAFPLWLQTQGYQLSLIYFNIVLKILVTSIREKKEIKEFQIRNEEIKFSLSADDMILCIENPKYAIRKLLKLINEFGKVTGWKITTLKPLAFYTLTTKNQKEKSRKQSHLPSHQKEQNT